MKIADCRFEKNAFVFDFIKIPSGNLSNIKIK